jgi:hypothetical protein
MYLDDVKMKPFRLKISWVRRTNVAFCFTLAKHFAKNRNMEQIEMF